MLLNYLNTNGLRESVINNYRITFFYSTENTFQPGIIKVKSWTLGKYIPKKCRLFFIFLFIFADINETELYLLIFSICHLLRCGNILLRK